MADKGKSNKSSKTFIDSMLHLRKCAYCRGKDGREKDVYETFQAALDTAQFVEKERGIYLNVYQCPHGNGWHLTKNNAPSEIIERKEILLQNNDIPLKSSDGSWEYIKDESSRIDENEFDAIIFEQKRKTNHPIPIVRVECESEINIDLYGKVIEIIANVNIEKIFGINLENVFCASMIKNILDGSIYQMTIYVESKENNQLESYTILIKNELLKKNKITKGCKIKINLIGKSINGIKRWCCNKILQQDLFNNNFS